MTDERYESAMRFYLLATKLKYKIRSGWDNQHWNVNAERLESVAEHIYGTCILALSLDSEFSLDINLNKVLKMLIIHEVGEILIGDITPFDNVTPEEKKKIEHKAMNKIMEGLIKKDELLSLLFEFDEGVTKEAKFAFYCDKLEADIQAKVYQDMGFMHTLDDQENNVVFKSDKVKKMVEDGASTAFDIWYLWDKDKYEESEVFARTLKHVKDNNTNI